MENKPRRNHYLFFLALLLTKFAHAETSSETLRFVSLNKYQKKEELVLKTYFNGELQKQVGAFSKRDKGNKTLLLYNGDGTSDESLDYELHWLEFMNGRVVGEYSLAKPRSAPIKAAYLKYKNSAARTEVIFGPSGKEDKDCVL